MRQNFFYIAAVISISRGAEGGRGWADLGKRRIEFTQFSYDRGQL